MYFCGCCHILVFCGWDTFIVVLLHEAWNQTIRLFQESFLPAEKTTLTAPTSMVPAKRARNRLPLTRPPANPIPSLYPVHPTIACFKSYLCKPMVFMLTDIGSGLYFNIPWENLKWHICRAINDNMVFCWIHVDTWVYSKTIQWHMHTGSWSLVNCLAGRQHVAL